MLIHKINSVASPQSPQILVLISWPLELCNMFAVLKSILPGLDTHTTWLVLMITNVIEYFVRPLLVCFAIFNEFVDNVKVSKKRYVYRDRKS